MKNTFLKIASYVLIPSLLTASLNSCVESTYKNGIKGELKTNAISQGFLSQLYLMDSNNDSVPDYLGLNTLCGAYAVDTNVHGSNSDYIGKETLLLGSEDFEVFKETNKWVNKSLEIIDN